MKIRIVSDLHCEFWGNTNVEEDLNEVIPPIEGDTQSVLCIAGDLGLYASIKFNILPYIKVLSKRFKAVCYVAGNHEWYGSSEWFNEKGIWINQNIPKNVYILNDDFIIIDGVVFIGSTLWTDFNQRNPVAMFHAQSRMSDFDCIRKRIGKDITRRIIPEDTVDRFYESKNFIFNALELFKEKKCVVITHHMPSSICVNQRYMGDLLNYAFHSELKEEILEIGKPDIWIHGHTHNSVNEKIGNTEIICNPFGYMFRETNRNYQPVLVKEII